MYIAIKRDTVEPIIRFLYDPNVLLSKRSIIRTRFACKNFAPLQQFLLTINETTGGKVIQLYKQLKRSLLYGGIYSRLAVKYMLLRKKWTSELLCGYYIERNGRLYYDRCRRNFVCIAHKVYDIGLDGACSKADATW